MTVAEAAAAVAHPAADGGTVRRRHVCFISGYDPQGVAGYHALFRRELRRFLALWPVQATVSEPEPSADGLSATWRIETAGPDWAVSTTYEFLRWDDLVRRDMARPTWRRLLLVLRCVAEHLADGTLRRVWRASWRFALVYLWSVLVFLCRALLPLIVGAASACAAVALPAVPWPLALAIGTATGVLFSMAARRFDRRWHGSQLCDNWLFYRDWVRGARPDFDGRIAHMAEAMGARARESGSDELLLVGHSAGGTALVSALAHALLRDPHVFRTATPTAAVGLGSSMPFAALQKRGEAVRAAIARVSIEPSLLWVDCQARKDVANFGNFDPVAGVGIARTPQHRNPTIWRVRLRDVLAKKSYRRARWRFMRMHYQYIMGNNRRAPYDFFMFVCGPVPFRTWAEDGPAALRRFGIDGSYRGGEATGAAVSR